MELKDINGYEGDYKISDVGDVYSYKHNKVQILKPDVNKKNYHRVRLSKNGKIKAYMVHQLVAIHFLENPMNLLEVNHINWDKSNNNVLNLEWVSHSTNIEHALVNNLMKGPKNVKGEKNNKNKFPEPIIREVKILLKNGVRAKDIIRRYPMFPFTQQNLYDIKSGKAWGWLEI